MDAVRQPMSSSSDQGRNAMAPPSKGRRRAPTIRLPEELIEILEQGRAETGVSSFSQYVSDVLAVHVRRPDLARELDSCQEVLPLTA